MKKCGKCLEEKSLESFSRKYDKYQTECKQCRAKYAQQHYLRNKKLYIERARTRNADARRKTKAFSDSLKSVPCADCKQTFDPICMDFDHVTSDKVANVSSLVSNHSLETVRREVAKCEVVCSNCHRLRTKNRLQIGRG